jgi:phosphoglycerol transferase MdoB-like AlkP superfamily enzyme
MVFLLILRIVFLCVNWQDINSIAENKVSLLLQAFVLGFRFDTVVLSYILMPIAIILFISEFSSKAIRDKFVKISYWIIIVTFSFVLLIAFIDLPYSSYFGSRLNSQALNWDVSPGFIVKMIAGNFTYILYTLLCISSIYVWYRWLKKIKNSYTNSIIQTSKMSILIFLYCFLFSVLIVGGRGRLSFKTTIKTGTSYISEYAVVNQLGLNPVFTLIKSCSERSSQSMSFMDEQKALAIASKSLKTSADFTRVILSDKEPLKANVVIVMMESLSSFYMGEYGGPHLTPFLDSLKEQAYFFPNFYSSGIHTYNGLFSTLYGYPAPINKNPLLNLEQKYTGLPTLLKDKGYSTLFFTTHDDQFDNVGGFMKYNGFQQIISEKDYPSNRSLSTWGVPDDYMFEYALPILSQQKKPFLSLFLTTTNHPPYLLPPYYKSTASSKQYATVEYTDWSVKQFLTQAKKQAWFNNTIFIFLGDHGINLGHTYDMPLSYHHVPLIVYSPLFKEAQVNNSLAGQIDVFPTLMGMLNISYTNQSMGIDLLKEKRPSIFFTADDKVGCLNMDYYFIHRTISGKETMYRYDKLLIDDYSKSNSIVFDSLKTYAYSMLQSSQYLLKNKN